jgi:ADP-ribosylglycohydrolase
MNTRGELMSVDKRNPIIGAVIGDVIGSIYEWENIKTTDFPLFQDSCFFTDDTVLTLALCESILSGRPYKGLMREYYYRYPHAGYGGSFKKFAQGNIEGPYNSYGNGSAMRTSSIGCAFDTLEEVLKKAEAYAAITHNHPEGIKGAQAVSAAIYLARTGSDKDHIRNYIQETFGYDLSRTCDDIRPDYKFDVTCQGTVPEAIIAFLESTDFEGAIRLAISLGGDSDTLGCICGSIAGAYYCVPDEIASRAESYLDEYLLGILKRFEDKYIHCK